MMMKTYIEKVFAVVALLMAIVFVGCTDEQIVKDCQVLRPSEVLSFRTSLQNAITVATSRSTSGHLLVEEEEWTLADTTSRASMKTSLDGNAKVLGFVKNGDALSYASPDVNSILTFRGDELTNTTNPVFWQDIAKKQGNDLHVFAYAPVTIPGATFAQNNPTSFTYTVPGIVDNHSNNQMDIVVGTACVPKNHRAEIPLTFKHIFTAVRFKLGVDCKVKSILLTGIKDSGTYTIGGNWTGISGNASYAFSYGDEGEDFKKDDIVGDVLMLLPQTLEGASVTMSYIDKDSNPQTFTATLTGKTWEEGKFITYTLRESAQGIIYLDLAAGNVTIKDKKYSGSYFTNETNKVIVPEQSFDPDKVIFHVYQSTKAKRKAGEGIIVGDLWKELKYDPVMWDGKPWSEFITNNTDVEAVIRAWDNEAGAGKKDESEPNQPGADGAVRKVGREATKNRIHITGNVGNINLIIDNIYSSYQEYNPYRTTGTIDLTTRKRTMGGISFIPSWEEGDDSRLTINIIGDNRLGCVNYQNIVSERNRLVFEGTGSLTVADTDYFRYDGNLGLNRSCSVIGGKDEPQSEEDVYNIEFNSGVIYAGATTSSCTAIGGGGNGDTSITINGGTITAVAKTTGTAIGGGTGLKQPGGQGKVTIKNGTVYAYNYKNTSNVPSSAIGGAGSRDVDGSLGEVNIEGGYVYAYSQYGTAIGGGSSQKTIGGKADIKISGGQIIAISGYGAGIGGGSACTGKSGTNKNGGDAEVTISGNPVIRTGSIGGGLTGAANSTIGSAKIEISGSPDIQAQFVMAAGSEKNKPEFKMYGGVIRNTDATQIFQEPHTTEKEYPYAKENEYRYTKEYGGAVYLEDGSFEMTGGTIENCTATNGGAVYVCGENNPTFTMKGGSIINCIANGNGGAVYLEGGSVTLNTDKDDTSISRNLANNGNGGGIYVDKGNFTMFGDVLIEGNSAMNKDDRKDQDGYPLSGKGGGLYVTSTEEVQVKILSGTIRANASDRFGGGVCVDMPEEAIASIVVGSDEGGNKESPSITGNHTLESGGGLYAKGQNANITINHGTINGNSTTEYVQNENVANEGGMVTLVGNENSVDVPHKIVHFHANGENGTFNENTTVVEAIQRIVTSTNSLLVQPTYIARPGYTFVGWHTRADGDDNKGKPYKNGDVMNISADLHLYAQWVKNPQ